MNKLIHIAVCLCMLTVLSAQNSSADFEQIKVGIDNSNIPDIDILENNALLRLGYLKSGPHGILFGDPTTTEGMNLLYRTSPNKLSLEKGNNVNAQELLWSVDNDGNTEITGDISTPGSIQASSLIINNLSSAGQNRMLTIDATGNVGSQEIPSGGGSVGSLDADTVVISNDTGTPLLEFNRSNDIRWTAGSSLGKLSFTGNTYFDSFTKKTGAYIEAKQTQNWMCADGRDAGTELVFHIQSPRVNDNCNQTSTINEPIMRLTSNGVSIGTNSQASDYMLSVGGKVASEEVLVQLQAAWPDYVFEEDYDLKPLSEVELYIQHEGHLPGIPSAAEAESNGIEVGEMNRLLLEKIEELTLHVIQQQRQINELKSQVEKNN